MVRGQHSRCSSCEGYIGLDDYIDGDMSSCDICGAVLCLRCSKNCNDCGNDMCLECSGSFCESCDQPICNDCLTECEECGAYFCSKCIVQHNDKKYCKKCKEEIQEITE